MDCRGPVAEGASRACAATRRRGPGRGRGPEGHLVPRAGPPHGRRRQGWRPPQCRWGPERTAPARDPASPIGGRRRWTGHERGDHVRSVGRPEKPSKKRSASSNEGTTAWSKPSAGQISMVSTAPGQHDVVAQPDPAWQVGRDDEPALLVDGELLGRHVERLAGTGVEHAVGTAVNSSTTASKACSVHSIRYWSRRGVIRAWPVKADLEGGGQGQAAARLEPGAGVAREGAWPNTVVRLSTGATDDNPPLPCSPGPFHYEPDYSNPLPVARGKLSGSFWRIVRVVWSLPPTWSEATTRSAGTPTASAAPAPPPSTAPTGWTTTPNATWGDPAQHPSASA